MSAGPGQPLAGGKIERGDGLTVVPEADIPRFTTDSDGVAEVPVVKSGAMQLVIDHSVSPSATPALAKTDMFNAHCGTFCHASAATGVHHHSGTIWTAAVGFWPRVA